MAKRFLHEDDKTELQNAIAGARQIAENASTTVQEVSVVAQQAAETAEEAAENALNAYSPTNKPTASDVGAVDKESYVEAIAWNAIQTKQGENWYRFQFITDTGLDGPFYLQLWKSTDSGLTWSPVKSYNLEKLFLSDGSVAIDKTLDISGNADSGFRIECNDNLAHMAHHNADWKNYAQLVLDKDDINGLSYNFKTLTGTPVQYKIYGEHNVTKGTSALTAGSSALGNGCIHLRYE